MSILTASSRIARRTHMYLALFLSPWLLMYTLSTLAMNHRAIFVEMHGGGPPPFHKERELVYEGAIPEGQALPETARQILASLDLDGAHTVSRRADGIIVINRNDLLAPRRILFTPSDGRLVVEKAEKRPNAFLERFHRRRGYSTGYATDTAWAVTVDLFVLAVVIWVLSGLWMWWEMRATRLSGAIAAGCGVALFVFYLFAI